MIVCPRHTLLLSCTRVPVEISPTKMRWSAASMSIISRVHLLVVADSLTRRIIIVLPVTLLTPSPTSFLCRNILLLVVCDLALHIYLAFVSNFKYHPLFFAILRIS